MIVGLGIDIVEIPRIQAILARFGMAFAQRVLHEKERALMPEIPAAAAPGGAENTPGLARAATHLASRFAAKEAAAKALGTGFSGGIGMHDIRILRSPEGAPVLEFSGAAEKRCLKLGVSASLLSLTHEKSVAGAVVVLEAHTRPAPSGTGAP